MISCPKCNNTFSFSSRLKSVNNSLIECDKCKTRYKMKYSNLLIFINILLISIISPRLHPLFPDANFFILMIISIAIFIAVSLVLSFILSYFIKYEEVEY